MASVMSGLSRIMEKSADEIAAMTVVPGEYIDDNDTAITSIGRAIAALQILLQRLVLRRSMIDKDGRLKGHHCESLHDAYEVADSAVAGLIEVLRNTRAAVITHDLKAEPRGSAEEFATFEDLLANLRST